MMDSDSGFRSSIHGKGTRSCVILVLNYNGRGLLSQYLESIVIAAAQARACQVDVIVVDNQSTDNSLEWLSAHFPAVKILLAPQNRYLYSLNWAAGELTHDWLLLLNNDVYMTPDCLDPLFELLLRYPQAFAVSPKFLRPDEVTVDSAKRVGEFWRGQLRHTIDTFPTGPAPTLFATGGAYLVRRNEFLAYGGFDELYYPAYWEDVDLSYRAWKRGRPSLYQPASVMYHHGSASMAAEGSEKSAFLNARNSWLFTWRNVSDLTILSACVFWTARHWMALRRRDQAQGLSVYHAAFRLWPTAIRGRIRRSGEQPLNDRQICTASRAASLAGLSDRRI